MLKGANKMNRSINLPASVTVVGTESVEDHIAPLLDKYTVTK